MNLTSVSSSTVTLKLLLFVTSPLAIPLITGEVSSSKTVSNVESLSSNSFLTFSSATLLIASFTDDKISLAFSISSFLLFSSASLTNVEISSTKLFAATVLTTSSTRRDKSAFLESFNESTALAADAIFSDVGSFSAFSTSYKAF